MSDMKRLTNYINKPNSKRELKTSPKFKVEKKTI